MNLSFGSAQTASIYDHARSANVFCAYSAAVAGLPAYTATTLGPILWNGISGNPQVKVVVLGVSVTVTVASAAAVAVGLAWGNAQPLAPTANTAATLVSCMYASGKQPLASSYISGTVAQAALGFIPLVNLDTTALTAQPIENMWIPLDGMIVLPVGSWCALAASATATTSALQYSIVWTEQKF
jgi:hypothetical protein